MTLLQRMNLWGGVVLLTLLLFGIYRHRLNRVCRWLPLYLGAVLAGDLALLLWTRHLYGWEFFVAKETLYGILKLVLAVDLAATMFSAFPGAAAAARYASLVALVSICAVLVAAHPAGAKLDDLAVELHPRLANGTVCLLLLVWALALWYHVPTHRFHRAILAGLSAYLLVFTVIVGYLTTPRSKLHPLVSLADSLGYLALLGYWTWEAWRREPAPPGPPEVLQRLQPWRSTP